MYAPPPQQHNVSSQSLQPTTKNENRNEDCFLSINIFFPFPQPTIKNENRYKDSLYSHQSQTPKREKTPPLPQPTLHPLLRD